MKGSTDPPAGKAEPRYELREHPQGLTIMIVALWHAMLPCEEQRDARPDLQLQNTVGAKLRLMQLRV